MRPGSSPFVLLSTRLGARDIPPPAPRFLARPYSSRFTYTSDRPTVRPVSARLKSLMPFFLWWSILTSLAFHRLRLRMQSRQELDMADAQISILESLIRRVSGGEVLSDERLRKELEAVGLRERTSLTKEDESEMLKARDVGWGEALFGRKDSSKRESESEVTADEWAQSESMRARTQSSDVRTDA